MHEAADPLGRIASELAAEGVDEAQTTRLLPAVYEELRALAAGFLARERSDHTLQATALVNEAYLRLAGGAAAACNDPAHFFRLAARTMRRILIDHARRKKAAKRGHGTPDLFLAEAALFAGDLGQEILDIDDALERLSALSPERARVVELRFYGGCTIEQTAAALRLSTATVERHWRFARAWLRAELAHHDTADG